MAFNAYMHERNIYRNKPDFKQMAIDYPEFRQFAVPDATGRKFHVDFTNTDALRMVTKLLLKKDFNLDVEIPKGFLIPTVPQRLNYILWIEDLLSLVQHTKESINGIDIGTGACAIFSLLGAQKNGWKFVATESSADAIQWAEKNISQNNLLDKIKIVKVTKGSALDEVLSADSEKYDFCLCNPPFFENIDEVRKKHKSKNETIADVSQREEIFIEGGELDFVKNIVKDSLIYKHRISIFTSMFGKKKSLNEIVKEIQEIKEAKFTTTEFCQGNTVRWGIAWTFQEEIQFQEKVKKKVKPVKAKPPLEYQIQLTNSENFKLDPKILDTLVEQTEAFLKILEIPTTMTRKTNNFVEFLLKSNKNTWSHQRRKRRELERQKKKSEEIGDLEKKPSVSANETDNVSRQSSNSKDNVNLTHDQNLEIVSNSNNSDIMFKDDKINTHLNDSKTIQNNASEYTHDVSNKRKGDFTFEELNKNKKLQFEKTILNEGSIECLNTFPGKTNKDIEGDTTMENVPITSDINVPEIDKELKLQDETICMDKTDCHFKTEDFEHSTCENSRSLQTENHERKEIENNKDAEVQNKTQDIDSENDLILNCCLQFIKANKKIYVKMNCPPTADRSVMHQVFLLIKNKIK